MPTALVSAMVVLGGNGAALADESGVSFWLLGTLRHAAQSRWYAGAT